MALFACTFEVYPSYQRGPTTHTDYVEASTKEEAHDKASTRAIESNNLAMTNVVIKEVKETD